MDMHSTGKRGWRCGCWHASLHQKLLVCLVWQMQMHRPDAQVSNLCSISLLRRWLASAQLPHPISQLSSQHAAAHGGPLLQRQPASRKLLHARYKRQR
jgi:hypothetical protein